MGEGSRSEALAFRDTDISAGVSLAGDLWEPHHCLHEFNVTVTLKVAGSTKIMGFLNRRCLQNDGTPPLPPNRRERSQEVN